VLRVHNVSRSWGSFGLRGINLEVAAGELFVLLGPSGAGKSRLLDLIAGFERPESGSIHIAGRDVTALPPERRNVGFVCQTPMLFPHMTVRSNISYGLAVRGVRGPVARERMETLAAELRVGPLMDRQVDGLSGGERQRIALARALAVEPDLLLLDEPFSSLDPPVKHGLWDALKGLQRSAAVTTVLVTHDRAEALALGERIGIMAAGRIEQTGGDLGVFERPVSHFVAQFTGGTNIYAGQAVPDGSLTVFESGSLRLVSTRRARGACKAVVRPENIVVSCAPARTSARNQLCGQVESVTRRGEVFEVAGRFGGQRMTSIITPQSVEDLGIVPGARVFFSFKAGSVHLFDGEQGAADDNA
jgi:molybdopterin-binding protein